MLLQLTYQTVAGFTQSLALVLFVSVFLGAVVYALWPGNAGTFERAARVPLDHDNGPAPRTPAAGRDANPSMGGQHG